MISQPAGSTEGSRDPTVEGEGLQLRVRAIAAGGAGVADLPDGRVVFIQRTAPGDLASVRLVREKARWAQGRLDALIEEGPGRRPAPCPYYARCGGCGLQHLRYLEQLRWKARGVADALQRIGGITLKAPPPVEPSPLEFRYRSRVSFHLRRLSGGRVVSGFHELERPGRILDLGGACLLPEEEVARLWDALRGAWGPGARLLPMGGRLRLTLRSVLGGVILVVEGGEGAGRPEELLARVPGLIAIWHRPQRESEVRLLAGEGAAEEAWLGESFRVGATAFLQVNRGAGEQLHQAVLRAVGAPRGLSVLDAYAGVGLLGRTLAHHGATVTAIEQDAAAVEAARDHAPTGFTVLSGRVEDRLDEALPVEVAVLNPPRGGLHQGVSARLVQSGVERIVYVSCDPATLARDLARLDAAYAVTDVRCFDLFPQTAHVETLATLVRCRPEPGTRDPEETSPCATT